MFWNCSDSSFFLFYILQHFLHLLLFKLQNYGQNTAATFSYHGHILISAMLLLLQSVFFLCADIWSLFIPLLSASGQNKPSCLKVIFVKIIYENFAIFFPGNFDSKTPTDICGCGSRCSFVLMWLFVLQREWGAAFEYNLGENISATFTETFAQPPSVGQGVAFWFPNFRWFKWVFFFHPF